MTHTNHTMTRFAKFLSLAATLSVVLFMTGCAHPITITPNVAKIEREAGTQPIRKNVAYYIAEDLHAKEITSAGGGGDKVSYYPYKDIETAFYKMLTNVFDNVTKLKTPDDKDALKKYDVSYIIKPKLITNSSSPSPFTWPPTKFSVEMTCDVLDASGRSIAVKNVTGHGNAEFDEFKSDFSLSARRASEDALLKMQRELSMASELKAPGATR